MKPAVAAPKLLGELQSAAATLQNWPPSPVQLSSGMAWQAAAPGMQRAWTQGIHQLGWIEQGRRPSIEPAIAASSRLAIAVSRHHPQRPLQRPSDLGSQQGTTALRALHQHHGLGQRHQQPISLAKAPRIPAAPGACSEINKPRCPTSALKPLVMARIDPLQRGAQHRNGRAACFQTALMGLSINTFRQPTDHGPARSGER